jgi:hypothetical protein
MECTTNVLRRDDASAEYAWCAAVLGTFLVPLRPSTALALEGIEIGPFMSDQHSEMDRRLAELEAEARHTSERYRLYRAKVYGPRLTSFAHLRELEGEARFAEGRLERTKAARG